MSPQHILLAAAGYMEKHGWCRRALCNDAGAVCLMGAVNAIAEFAAAGDALELLRKHIDSRAIGAWNDHVCFSKEKAVAALKGAAMMSTIGEPLKRHEVIPLKTEPVPTPAEPKAPVKQPEKEPA